MNLKSGTRPEMTNSSDSSENMADQCFIESVCT